MNKTPPTGENLIEWETYLDNTVGVVDNNNINENPIKGVQKVRKSNINRILEQDSLEQIIKQLEIEYDIKININYNTSWLEFLKNDQLVGRMYLTEYTDADVYSDKHLYFKLEDKYKGIGLGNIMFKLYERISLDENNEFQIFDDENTNIASMVFFYQKQGYEIIGKSSSGMNIFSEWTDDDDKELIDVKNSYIKGFEEKPLNYTVILKRYS